MYTYRLSSTFLRVNRQKDGFFIEVGAVDGELYSNSLFLERQRGWRGLLIEAIPASFSQLLTKNRRAYAINAALSVVPYASSAVFKWVMRVASSICDGIVVSVVLMVVVRYLLTYQKYSSASTVHYGLLLIVADHGRWIYGSMNPIAEPRACE